VSPPTRRSSGSAAARRALTPASQRLPLQLKSAALDSATCVLVEQKNLAIWGLISWIRCLSRLSPFRSQPKRSADESVFLITPLFFLQKKGLSFYINLLQFIHGWID